MVVSYYSFHQVNELFSRMGNFQRIYWCLRVFFFFFNDCEKSLGGRLLDKGVKAMHCVPGAQKAVHPPHIPASCCQGLATKLPADGFKAPPHPTVILQLRL